MGLDGSSSRSSFRSVIRITPSPFPDGVHSHLNPSRTAPEPGDLPLFKQPVELEILEVIVTVVKISDLDQHKYTSLFIPSCGD